MNVITQADVAIGYTALLFYLSINGENLVALNPTIFAEMGSLTWITFRVPYMQFTMMFNFLPYKLTIMDYQASWSMDNKTHFCQSAGYS